MQSADLNPTENLCSIVKRWLGQYQTAPSNLKELWQSVQQESQTIPNEILEKLVESIPKCVKNFIKYKGESIEICSIHTLGEKCKIKYIRVVSLSFFRL